MVVGAMKFSEAPVLTFLVDFLNLYELSIAPRAENLD